MATELLFAYHNHGRWIAECPHCHFAIAVRPGFVDFLCGRLPNGRLLKTGCGLEAKVQWPADVEGIEVALAERSRTENRNWLPGETVVDLLAQTLEREHA